MFVLLVFCLHSLLSPALGQTIPEADYSSFIPDSEGDLYFLLDSSGSVSYDEFSKVKEFIGDLLQPFKFGPQDVQASVVQISTNPTLEFSLNQYHSSKDVIKAIQNVRQRMGDTNTGKAIDYVKQNLYAENFGSRGDVPKVLVWMTDGLSTDDISTPMKLLKDMGVSVFIISTTGRGNFQDLSAAASEPDEKYLKFVDKDDLGIITKELRDSIIELIQTKRFHAVNITTTSIQLTWPRLLSKDTGHYVLEYVPVADPRKKLQHTLRGDQTSLEITGLTADTSYKVTLYPESNIEYLQPQTIEVSTLQEVKEERNLEALNITTTSFWLTWSRLSGDTGTYLLEYSPMSDPRRKLQKTTSVEETSVVLSNLTPNATYKVTLIPESNYPNIQPETIQVSTLPDYIPARSLKIFNITSTSFNASWSKLAGDTGRYFLDYALLSYPRRKTRKTFYGYQTSVVVGGLTPNTTYQVTFIPESNLEASQSQTFPVTTLPDIIQARNLQVYNITSRSLHLSWSRLEGDTGHYIVNYVSASQPHATAKMSLHDENSVEIRNLRPNTTYQITFVPESNRQYIQRQSIELTTLPEHTRTRNLQAQDITSTGFILTWSRLPEDEGRYVLEYVPVSDPGRTQQKIVYGDETSVSVSDLRSDTTYQVTLIPEYSGNYALPEVIMVSTRSEPIQPRSLQVINITATSFLVTWSRVPGDWGSYVLEYSPILDPSAKFRKTLSGDVSSAMVSNLASNTTYQVSLIHESGVQYASIQVSTLMDRIEARNLHVQDITSTSFQLSWSRLAGDTGRYVLEYAPLTDLSKTIQNVLYGDLTSMLFSNLNPDTVYQVTFIPDSKGHFNQVQRIRVSTLPDPIKARNLHIQDRTSTSFQLSWSRLAGDTGRYVLEYAPLTDLSKTIQNVLYGDLASMFFSNLNPDTVYQVTFIPDSKGHFNQVQRIRVSTLPEPGHQRSLQAINITATSFLVTWSRVPGDWGSYVVEYSPILDPSAKFRKTLSGDVSSAMVSNLASNTTYQVSLIHESGVQYASIQVSTLMDPIKARNLHVQDRTSTSFQLSWSRLAGDTGRYVLEYAPLTDLSKTIQNVLNGDLTSMLFSNLNPDTVYQVTFIPNSKGHFNQVQRIRVSTLPEVNQRRPLYTRDITTSSFQLDWSRVPGDNGPYIVELELVSDPRRKLRKTLPLEQMNVIFSHLSPNTQYRATVFSESNIQHVPPQSIQVSTLEEQLSPFQILISDPSAHSFRVSWGPNLDSVAGYEIQYGPIPSNIVRTLQVDSRLNSTVLENLRSNTTYLVTVSAIFKSGGEKALSAIACTEHNETKVKYLHLKDLGSSTVKATWGSADGDVQGYHVRCRRQAGRSTVISVAPQAKSIYLTDLAEGTMNKICVMPIYKDGDGKNLCRKIQMQPGTSANNYSSISTR
ncbi:collagen alpha-1(XII) chain-like isoform X1 [Bufo gargarizans]|uniref:collagen alpha-1(XII) chain-like isoform X1 n=1 Tax=Bufo gargarizans TaxID=30331 RepID=UPI001CF28F76|nr:collagen alpha-1(XII) chain-like isoform X1 [Bufo gargarizans]